MVKKHHQNELKAELAAWSINNRALSPGFAENMSWLPSKSKKLQQVSIITCSLGRKAVEVDEKWTLIYSWLGKRGDIPLESTNQGFKQKSQWGKKIPQNHSLSMRHKSTKKRITTAFTEDWEVEGFQSTRKGEETIKDRWERLGWQEVREEEGINLHSRPVWP